MRVLVRRIHGDRAFLYAAPSDPEKEEKEGWAGPDTWPKELHEHIARVDFGRAVFAIPDVPDAVAREFHAVFGSQASLPPFFSAEIHGDDLGDGATDWANHVASLRTQPQLAQLRLLAQSWFLTDFSPAGVQPTPLDEQGLEFAIARWFKQSTNSLATETESEQAQLRVLSVLASGLFVECEFKPGGLEKVAELDFVEVSAPVKPMGLELTIDQDHAGFAIGIANPSPLPEALVGGTVRCHCEVGGRTLPRSDTPITDTILAPTLFEVGPFEELDELFQWEVELVDELGQVHFRSFAEQVRRRCFRPTAPTEVEVDFAGSGPCRLAYEPPPAVAVDPVEHLRLEVWVRSLPLAPVGFYGDDDDGLVLEGLRALDLFVDDPPADAGDWSIPDGELTQEQHEALISSMAKRVPAEARTIARALGRDLPTYDPLLDDCTRVHSQPLGEGDFDADLQLSSARSHEVFFRVVRTEGSAGEQWSASRLQRCRHFVLHGGARTEVAYLEKVPEDIPSRAVVRGAHVGVSEAASETGSLVHLAWKHRPTVRIPEPGVPPGGYRIWGRDVLSTTDAEPFHLLQTVRVLHPRIFALYRPSLTSAPANGANADPDDRSGAWRSELNENDAALSPSEAARSELENIVRATAGTESSDFRAVDLRPENLEELRRLASELSTPLATIHALHHCGYAVWLAPKASALDEFLDKGSETLVEKIRKTLNPQGADDKPPVSLALATFEGAQGAFAPVLVVVPPKPSAVGGNYSVADWRVRHRFVRPPVPDEPRPLGRPNPLAGVSRWAGGNWMNWTFRELEEDGWAHDLEFMIEPLDRYALFHGALEVPTDDRRHPLAPPIPDGMAASAATVPRRTEPAQPVVIAEVSPNETAFRFRVTEPEEIRASNLSALRRVRLGHPKFDIQPTGLIFSFDEFAGWFKAYAAELAPVTGESPYWWPVRPNDTDLLVDEPRGTRRLDVHRPYWFAVLLQARVVIHDRKDTPWDAKAAGAIARRVPNGLGMPELPTFSVDGECLVVRLQPARLRDHLQPTRREALGNSLERRLREHVDPETLPEAWADSMIADLLDPEVTYEFSVAVNRRPTPTLKRVAIVRRAEAGPGAFEVSGGTSAIELGTHLKITLEEPVPASPRLFLRLTRDGRTTEPVELKRTQNDGEAPHG